MELFISTVYKEVSVLPFQNPSLPLFLKISHPPRYRQISYPKFSLLIEMQNKVQ